MKTLGKPTKETESLRVWTANKNPEKYDLGFERRLKEVVE